MAAMLSTEDEQKDADQAKSANEASSDERHREASENGRSLSRYAIMAFGLGLWAI